MQLKDLLSSVPVEVPPGLRDVSVEGLACDSREVSQGDLFVAYRGVESDGHRFLPQAVEAGAAALVLEEER